MIVKEGKQWILYTKDGKKVLGRHKSRREAKLQEMAIKYSQDAKEKGKS